MVPLMTKLKVTKSVNNVRQISHTNIQESPSNRSQDTVTKLASFSIEVRLQSPKLCVQYL
jgi:hypothetical protein